MPKPTNERDHVDATPDSREPAADAREEFIYRGRSEPAPEAGVWRRASLGRRGSKRRTRRVDGAAAARESEAERG